VHDYAVSCKYHFFAITLFPHNCFFPINNYIIIPPLSFASVTTFEFTLILQLFNNLVLRACQCHLRPLSLRSELYDTDSVKQKAAAATLMLPLHLVKSAHIRKFLDEALVTKAEERIHLDKVRACSALSVGDCHTMRVNAPSVVVFRSCLTHGSIVAAST
jgi:hypothetical protein